MSFIGAIITTAYAFHSSRVFPHSLPVHAFPEPRRAFWFPVEIILVILEAGYYTHDLQQDTQFLLSACLVSRTWLLPSQMLLFRHVIIRSQLSFKAFYNTLSSHATRGHDLARQVRSLKAVLDPEQPGCLRPRSFVQAVVSLSPNLIEIDLACYPLSKPTPSSYQQRQGKQNKQISVFDEEALDKLRSGPSITSLRLANWSSDRLLLEKLLSIYGNSLRTLSLRGTTNSNPNSNSIPTTPIPLSSPLPTPLHSLHLTLEPPLTPSLHEWLTNCSHTNDQRTRPRIHALEFTRQPEFDTLAALLAAHGETLMTLALPTLTTASAALVASYTRRGRLQALRTEHPYSTLPPPLPSSSSSCTTALHGSGLRHAALALGPALSLVRKEMRAGAGAGVGTGTGSDNCGSGRLESLSVMLWRGEDEEERENVSALKVLCAQLGIRLELEWEVKSFRERFGFWAAPGGVVF
ncbi:hypothetical protein B0F90DRAFT_1825080 [Multifurca ochricompacta]|uniref:Uncharacterized protein n=1 Tax=Multifurca ochricompacta TaxID=376703 RepID=A0AAD4LWQ1_9AGAM|nr:hypothetical protein B0F90DRAFT_1825080 [Multifurca ochricompacta]